MMGKFQPRGCWPESTGVKGTELLWRILPQVDCVVNGDWVYDDDAPNEGHFFKRVSPRFGEEV